MNMSGWVWGLAVVAGIAALLIGSVRHLRRNIRREFILALRKAHPDVEILSEGHSKPSSAPRAWANAP
jgi:hypothetical protein